ADLFGCRVARADRQAGYRSSCANPGGSTDSAGRNPSGGAGRSQPVFGASRAFGYPGAGRVAAGGTGSGPCAAGGAGDCGGGGGGRWLLGQLLLCFRAAGGSAGAGFAATGAAAAASCRASSACAVRVAAC